ncbi:hypothetical protein OKW32_000011 [Paraburkholderia youngii]
MFSSERVGNLFGGICAVSRWLKRAHIERATHINASLCSDTLALARLQRAPQPRHPSLLSVLSVPRGCVQRKTQPETAWSRRPKPTIRSLCVAKSNASDTVGAGHRGAARVRAPRGASSIRTVFVGVKASHRLAAISMVVCRFVDYRKSMQSTGRNSRYPPRNFPRASISRSANVVAPAVRRAACHQKPKASQRHRPVDVSNIDAFNNPRDMPAHLWRLFGARRLLRRSRIVHAKAKLKGARHSYFCALMPRCSSGGMKKELMERHVASMDG